MKSQQREDKMTSDPSGEFSTTGESEDGSLCAMWSQTMIDFADEYACLLYKKFHGLKSAAVGKS